MIQLFPKIQEAFENKKALFTDNALPEIAFVDVYMGQPITPEEFEFVLPAVFIDYSIDWNQNLINIDAHVLSEFGEESGSPFDNKAEGINYLKVLAICRYILTGIKTDNISRLKPLSERPATTEYYHYHILSFQANIQDYIDNTLIPARLKDATGVKAVIDKHIIKQKGVPSAEGMVDL